MRMCCGVRESPVLAVEEAVTSSTASIKSDGRAMRFSVFAGRVTSSRPSRLNSSARRKSEHGSRMRGGGSRTALLAGSAALRAQPVSRRRSVAEELVNVGRTGRGARERQAATRLRLARASTQTYVRCSTQRVHCGPQRRAAAGQHDHTLMTEPAERWRLLTATSSDDRSTTAPKGTESTPTRLRLVITMEEEFYDASEAWSEGEGADSGDGGPQAATASAQAPPGEPTRAAEACGGCQPALGGAGEAYPLHRCVLSIILGTLSRPRLQRRLLRRPGGA